MLRKEHEIVAAPRLLKGVNLRGTSISGDAMVAQRGPRTQVVEDGGDSQRVSLNRGGYH